MKARYSRISTPNQSLERQIQKQNPDEILFSDVVSGTVAFADRAKGKILLEEIRAGRITWVSVASICRLGRNLHDIINTLAEFQSLNVTVRVDNLGLESIVDGKVNPTFNLIVSVMANVGVMERETLLERQKEGIALAKAKGVYKGRVRGSVESDSEVLSKYKDVVKYLNRNQSIRNCAKLSGVSVGTVQKVQSILKKSKHESV
ncbi:recombinase family protein [Flavobacterium sp.]